MLRRTLATAIVFTGLLQLAAADAQAQRRGFGTPYGTRPADSRFYWNARRPFAGPGYRAVPFQMAPVGPGLFVVPRNYMPRNYLYQRPGNYVPLRSRGRFPQFRGRAIRNYVPRRSR